MQKINYFELLEEISLLCTRAVFLASRNTRPLLQKAISECQNLQEDCLQKICTLENFLFTDFLPPLERRSIAEAAHEMSKIIECSYQMISQKLQKAVYDKRAKEQDTNIELAKLIEESIGLLKKIKKPNQLPENKKFREILLSARKLSHTSIKRQSPSALCTTELRHELSACFDKIIEIMLCNI